MQKCTLVRDAVHVLDETCQRSTVNILLGMYDERVLCLSGDHGVHGVLSSRVSVPVRKGPLNYSVGVTDVVYESVMLYRQATSRPHDRNPIYDTQFHWTDCDLVGRHVRCYFFPSPLAVRSRPREQLACSAFEHSGSTMCNSRKRRPSMHADVAFFRKS